MARMLFLRDITSDVHLRCCACGHSGVLPRGMLERRFGPNYPVLSIAPHYRCSRCDSRDTESRPVQAQAAALETDDSAADPSFDASLSALNGLLASIRGEDPPPAPRRADPPPERPAFTPAPFPLPPLPDFAAIQDDHGQDDAESDWDLGNRAPLDALPPEEEADPFDAPPPPRKPARPPARPLEELIADGPADDAEPLWEPVSLADMANREGANRQGTKHQGASAPPPEECDDDEDWAPPPPRRATTRPGNDSDEDETLAAMRRFFAESERADEDEDDRAFTPADRNPARLGRHAPPDVDDLPLELDEEDAVSDAEPVFSHKAFVRQDFEDDPEDEDAFADDHAMDRDSTNSELGDSDLGDSDLGDPARRWADHLDDEDEEEPTDAEILAFAIRDPEIRSPAPPPPPPAPVKAKAERSPRRAPTAAADGDEDGGFDKTLAALRSMIEDAAVEPKPSARRKAKPAPPPEPALDDLGGAPPDDEAMDDAPPPPRRPTGKASAKPSASKGGNSKQSAQEREIEEAMKALRDLVEDDEDTPPPASAKATPAVNRPLPRPAAWEEDDDLDTPRHPPRTPDPLPLMEDPAPPPPASPPRPAAQDMPTKEAAPKEAAKDSPLSKTIAALRGMLELDGRKKR